MIKTALLWGAAAALALLSGACGKPKPEPLVPVEVTNFEELYAENCSGCHGVDGKNGAAQSLNYPVFLALIPKEKLRDVIANGVSGSLMAPFSVSSGGELSDKQVGILTDGIEKWANSGAVQTAELPPYSSATQGDAAAGKQTFKMACAVCHGEKGYAGSLTNESFLQLTTNQSLRTSIITGRPQFGMPDWNHHGGHALSDADIGNLVAYLSSQRNGPLASDEPSAPAASSGGDK